MANSKHAHILLLLSLIYAYKKKIEFHIHLALSNDGMKHIPVQNFVFSFSCICNNW